MRVRYTPQATNDLAAILAYLDARSPTGARSVKRAIRAAVALISEFPEIGLASGESDSRVMRTGSYPYLVYWRIRQGEVHILHLRHTARERP